MRMLNAALVLPVVLATSSAGADCRYDAPREAQLDAVGLQRIEIDAGAGELRILGRSGSAEISVRGTACASNRGRLEEIELRATRSGDTARIEVTIPSGGWSLFSGDNRLDLEIDVPDSIPLEVLDSSGAVEVSGIASLDLQDSSGSIEIDDVSGDVRVRDSSGSIGIERVGGDIRISDSSGQIEVAEVSGSVTIDEDGSGSIEIVDVERDVRVRRDGSGHIAVRRIGGDFVVDHDSSGGIRHSDVEGAVRIPNKR